MEIIFLRLQFSIKKFVWVLFVSTVFASAMSSTARAQETSPLDPIALQLGWKHQYQFAGYYAAKEQGFYKEVGLDVSFLEGGPGKSCFQIMMSGVAQYCADDGDNIFHFIKGTPMMVIAVIFQHSPTTLITLQESNLTEPRDLIGKRVELLHGGIPIPEIKAMFDREGISLDMLDLQEDSFGVERLLKGEVDAVYAYMSNEPEFLEKLGVSYNLIRPRTYGIDFYGDILLTSAQEVDKNEERMKAFRKATLKGWEYAMDHQVEIANLIREKYNSSLSLEHLLYEANTIKKLMVTDLIEIGHMNPSRWRHMADIMSGQNLIEPGYSLERFIYDPNYQSDYTRVFQILAAVIALSGLGIAILIIFNNRLKREVDERKRVEENLEKARDEAESANTIKSRILLAVSHDLRQPIHAISLFSSALQSRLAGGENASLVTKIQGAISNLGNMLDGLLDMSRLENDTIVPQTHDFPVQDLFDQILAEDGPAAAAKDIDLKVVPSSAVLHSDQALLSRILGNFVTNAIRYTEQGRILIGCRKHNRLVKLEVWDTGRGMTNEEIHTIFEPYQRLNWSRNYSEDGLGLGLAISYGLSHLLDHPVSVRSWPGKGSCFTIEVPLGSSIPDDHVHTAIIMQENVAVEGFNILVVDDDKSVLDDMKAVLTEWGCQASLVDNADDALAAAAQLGDGLDVVMTDFHLAKNITGLDLLGRINEKLDRDVPAIVITGDTQPERELEIEAAGYFMLPKPVQPVSLRPLLRRQLRKRAP